MLLAILSVSITHYLPLSITPLLPSISLSVSLSLNLLFCLSLCLSLPKGGLSVAIPGELAGMKMAHDMFGRQVNQI